VTVRADRYACPDTGQSHVVKGFGPFSGCWRTASRRWRADKGYDADPVFEELANAGVQAVISGKSNRRVPSSHDREKYRWQNLLERLL
jgi:hypothetical protein